MKVKLDWGRSIAAFKDAAGDISDDTDKEIRRIVDRTADDVLRMSKSGTPVDTGNLKAGWKMRKLNGKQPKVEVSNDVSYGGYVEYGTFNRPPRRMLTKAMIRGNKLMRARLNRLGRSL